jgi:eukaryotic-like serine/threonine-protein kinase
VGGAPTVAPGLMIAERYRIDALLSGESGYQRVGQLWRAYDEVLARPVAILLVPDEDPGVQAVLAGARAAARLTHAALVRVYDAGEVPGLAFVVTEFLSGGSLEGQLALGPLDPAVAVDLVADLATAVAAAHGIGLHGLSLTPRSVLFTATGAPRLAGIAVAGHTTRAGDPPSSDSHPPDSDADGLTRERFDAIGLARLLYAALTGRWAGATSDSTLPPAPYAEGHLLTPRQVRGGVPREVDAVVAQALGDDLLLRGLPAIDSPAALAAALAPMRTSAGDDGHPYGADTQPISELDLRTRRRSGARPVLTAHWRQWAILLALVLVGVVIFGLLPGSPSYLRFVTGAAPPTASNPSPTATTSPTIGAAGDLTPRAVSEFDPYGDHTDPHVSEAPRAADGNPTTAWRTQTFRTADLGKRKPGVGLLVDFGDPRKVSAVHLRLIGAGTSVTLYSSNATAPPANEKAMTAATSQANAPSDVTLTVPPGTTARYWVVWLTSLPAGRGGFQGGVAEMTFLP